jgi:hypothetical protein
MVQVSSLVINELKDANNMTASTNLEAFILSYQLNLIVSHSSELQIRII